MNVTEHNPKAAFPTLLRTFCVVTAVLSLGCWTTELLCRFILHLNFQPYNCPTFARIYDYADMRMFPTRFRHFHTTSFFDPRWGSHYLYPATLSFFYEPFFLIGHRHDKIATVAFLAFLLCVYSALAFFFWRKLKEHGLSPTTSAIFTLTALLFSYPFYVDFNRANMEIFVWGISALGVLAFMRNRPWLAATLIGLAGACKGYPYIYLGLLFARKQYRQMAYSVLLGILINLTSTWIIADNFTIGRKGVAEGVQEFVQTYVLQIRPLEIGLDHSIFGLIKRLWPHLPPPNQLAHYLSVYMVIAAVTACTLYFFRAYHLPVINQVLFLTIAAITLPPTSYDYTLLHLYTGWTLLVFLIIDLWRKNLPMPQGLWPALGCLMLLLTPQNEFIYHGERLEGPIKCLTLLALAYIILRYPFHGSSQTLTASEV